MKRILCLANSRKPGGRCVAGKDMETGRWIRPVSVRPTAEISLEERRYEDGSEPATLDVIEIPLMAHTPHLHQTENHMIEHRAYWKRAGSVEYTDLAARADGPAGLWHVGDSSYHGQNDRVPHLIAATHNYSLCLIRVKAVKFLAHAPGAGFDDPKRRVRAIFRYGGVGYDLRVTDPQAERAILARPNGGYPMNCEMHPASVSLKPTPIAIATSW